MSTRWLVTILGLIAALAVPQFASASTTADLCSTSLNQGLEAKDRSLVLLGHTSKCEEDGTRTDDRYFLVGLTSSGEIRSGFGDGGVVLIPRLENEAIPNLVETSDGSYLLQTNLRVRAFNPDGSPQTGFGDSGEITPASPNQMNATPRDIFATGNGGFVLTGVRYEEKSSGPQGIWVGRYNGSGKLVSSFGTGGLADTRLSTYYYDTELAIDGQDRILVANRHFMTRLLPDGDVDETFGNENNVVDLTGYLPVHEITVGDEGEITVLSVGDEWLYSHPAYAQYFGADGEALPEKPKVKVAGFAWTAITYPGGIAYAAFPSRGFDPGFAVGTSPTKTRSYHLTPSFGQVFGLTALADGSILAVGSSSGGAVLKLDPATGDPVKSFGAGGSRLIPGNSCKYGSSGRVGDWKICRVMPPVVTGSASLSGRFGLRPSLTVRASLGKPPENLWGTRQVLTVKLPPGLRLKEDARKRIVTSTVPGRPRVMSVSGSTIKIKVKPRYEIWQDEYVSNPGKDARLTIRLKLKRGSLLPIPRKPRSNLAPIRVQGTFIPVAGGAISPPVRAWFGPKSAKGRIRIGR